MFLLNYTIGKNEKQGIGGSLVNRRKIGNENKDEFVRILAKNMKIGYTILEIETN